MLHECGPVLTRIRWQNNPLRFGLVVRVEAHFALYGFRPRWASHLDRSTSSHSYGYAGSVDRPTCFAHHALIPEAFMQHAD